MHRIQFDVETAFLHGKLDETIFMTAPAGLQCPAGSVLKLNKSIYGLKQAPRVWKDSLDRILALIGLRPTDADPCLDRGFILQESVLLIVYVDDGLAFSASPGALQQLFSLLAKQLKVRIVDSNVFVGYEIQADGDVTTVHQQAYIGRMLRSFNMHDSIPVPTPITDTATLQSVSNDDEEAVGPYRALIGSLLYCACATRPDILFAVCLLAKFSNDPRSKHWTAAKRVLRYPKGSLQVGIQFKNGKTRSRSLY